MHLHHALHLAYCTNIHRGEAWAEIFQGLKRHTLAVRDRVGSKQRPFAIGLRLGAAAAIELSDSVRLLEFQRWLEGENCYVFTINGFPYGQFHGVRVKEQVYRPDWTTGERLEYTNRLFDLLARIVPRGVAGSVSTVPCSAKEFQITEAQAEQMRGNLWRCVEHVAALSERTGLALHLGLEPEPLCYLETSDEMARFYGTLRADHPADERLERHLGINYDTCHLACEFETPAEALSRLREQRVPISKIHLSSALRLQPTAGALAELASFAEDTYLHQVIERDAAGAIRRFRDLDVALADAAARPRAAGTEWRVHFHVPLHCRPKAGFETTADHVLGVLDALARNPVLCQHLEMETYTWEVLPGELKTRDVVDQLAGEYEWTLAQLAGRGLA